MVDLLTVLHEGDQRLYRKALRTVEQSAKRLKIEVPQPTEGFVTSGESAPKSPYLQLAGDHGIRLFTTAFCARPPSRISPSLLRSVSATAPIVKKCQYRVACEKNGFQI